jgi:hypothetical protein
MFGISMALLSPLSFMDEANGVFKLQNIYRFLGHPTALFLLCLHQKDWNL